MDALEELAEALKYHIVTDKHGTKRYYNSDGQYHRLDGPAVQYAPNSYGIGAYVWFKNGVRHCTTGPAIRNSIGHLRWWIDGVEVSQAKFNELTK